MPNKIAITILLAMALFLPACSTGADGDGSPDSPAEIENQDGARGALGEFIDLEDGGVEEEYRLMALVWTGIARQAWDTPAEIAPDRLIDFYRLLAGDLYGEVAIPEEWESDEAFNLLMPADAVEQAVRRHFDVSEEHLRTSSYYDAGNHCYRHGGLGSVANARITAFEPGDGNGPSTIAYEFYQDDTYLGAGALTLEMNGEEYRYLSNIFVSDPPGPGQQDTPGREELVGLASGLMQEGYTVFWWYHSDYPDTLELDTDEDNWIQGEWQTYAKVGRFATMDELKAATESIFTRDFCEAHFYDKVEEYQKFYEIDGVLYHNLQSGGMGWIFALPKEYAVKTTDDDTIVLTAVCDGLDNREGADGEAEYEFEVTIKNEDGAWKLDNWYTYTPESWDGVEMIHRDEL